MLGSCNVPFRALGMYNLGLENWRTTPLFRCKATLRRRRSATIVSDTIGSI